MDSLSIDAREARKLSLSELNGQIRQHYPIRPLEADSPTQTRAIVVVFLAVATSLVSALFLPADWAKLAVLVSLAAEILAVIVFVLSGLHSLNREKMKETFASELDADYRAQAIVTSWIRTHDPADISDKLRFVQTRMATLARRSGVIVGGVEKLGALPMAVALFLQFRDVQLGWPLSITWSAWVLGLIVASLYVVGLFAQSLKLRLHLYETLLQEALHHQDDGCSS
jgi:hypothetical protein